MDDGDELQITPSFKSKKKGKGKLTTSSTRDSSNRDADAPASPAENNGHDQDEELSAVVFKKSAKAGKSKGLGASSSPSSSSRKPQDARPGMTASRSKLNLSFGGEGDQEEDEADTSSVIRRSDSSRKLKRPPSMLGGQESNSTDRTLSTSMSQASLSNLSGPSQASGPSYSKDYLAELKASTQSAPSSAVAPASNGSGAYDALTMSKFGASAMQEEEESTLLPSESAIAAAKARRETARRLGVDNMASDSSGFISLEVGPVLSNRESRLVREEDEMGDGEDDHAEYTEASERIQLGKKGKAAREKSRREGILEAIDMDNEMVDEDDEEAREWEMAQIRRGEQRRLREDENGKEPYRPATIPEATTVPSLLTTSNRLSETLKEMQLAQTEYETLSSNMSREKEALDGQEKELRLEVERVNGKYEWFIELRGWVEEVASFLEEKFPVLEKVENDNLSIQKERLDIIAKRRFKDDSDDLSSFTGAAVPTSWDKDPSKSNGDQDMEVDDFGRSREDTDLEPRSFARRTRREERKRRKGQAADGPTDGYETDNGLLSGDSQDLSAAAEALSKDVENLFSDVQAEEYRSPNVGVRPRFEEWKRRYGEDYANAFAGLAMVTVWEFWARAELAEWNPFGIKELHESPAHLDAFECYKALASYQDARANSAGPGGEEQLAETGDDVVSSLVSTVIVPRLRVLAVDAYDPYSSKETTKALGLVDEITYCIETNSARFEHLIQGFLAAFVTAVRRIQDLVVARLEEIHAPMISMDTDGIAARNAFAQRLVKLLSNALRWRRYAKGLVVEGEGTGTGLDSFLSEELVERTLLPILEAGWETGGSEMAARVSSLLATVSIPAAVRNRLQGRQ